MRRGGVRNIVGGRWNVTLPYCEVGEEGSNKWFRFPTANLHTPDTA